MPGVFSIPLITQDVGAVVNEIFEREGDNTHVKLAAGRYNLQTPIKMGPWSHLNLSGAGYMQTLLMIPPNSQMIGVDMWDSDEAKIQDIQIVEGPGFRTCAGIRIGGTTAILERVWAAGCKYGIYSCGAGGWLVTHSVIEGCDFGLFVASRHNDTPIGCVGGTNTHHCLVSDTILHNCQKRAIKLANYEQCTIAGLRVAVGDVITGAHGSATVVDVGDVIVIEINEGRFTDGDTIVNEENQRGVIDNRLSNLLKRIDFRGMRVYLSDQLAVDVRNVHSFSFEGTIAENNEAGMLLRDVDGFRINATFANNTGTGLIVDGGYGTLTGCVAHNEWGSDQTKGLEIRGSAVVEQAGNLWSNP